MDQDAFIKTLSSILDLIRLTGNKSYEYYTHDLLTSLHNKKIANFKKALKYCDPIRWSFYGFKNQQDHDKLREELQNLEKLMIASNINPKSNFFRSCKPLELRLKEFD